MRAVVVGAGIAGLCAARALAEDGHDVVVLDKGRGPGGRLATRRVGGGHFDHGAQFFTVRSETFAALVARWREEGVVHEWCRGFTDPADGFARYAVRRGMNRLAKHLATGLDVRCDSLVFAIRPSAGGGWAVGLDDGTSVAADAVVVTCPLPQAFAVLVASGVGMPEALRTTEYDRTLSLMLRLDGPGAVPAPGGVQDADEVFSFVGDNMEKGVSTVPALTLNANATWSETHWDMDRDAVRDELVSAAQRWVGGARVLEHSVKRWRFATPRTIWPEPCWVGEGGAGPVVLAGDAFAGPRVEGAACSGLAAADALLA